MRSTLISENSVIRDVSHPKNASFVALESLLDSESGVFDGPFGSNLKSSDYSDSGMRVLRLENIGRGVFVDEKTYISEAKYKTLRRHTLRDGDILFSSFVAEYVRCCRFPAQIGTAINKADCFCLRPDSNLLDTDFLLFMLSSPQFYEQLRNQIKGVTRPRINTTALRSAQIPLLPLDLQKRVAGRIIDLFAEIDVGIEELVRTSERIEIYRQSVLNAAIQGKLIPQDPSDEPALAILRRFRSELDKSVLKGNAKRQTSFPPFDLSEMPYELPKGWEWVRLGQVADHCLGKMLDKAKNKGGPQRYLRNVNVRWFDFDLDDLLEMRFEENERERFQIRCNDLVICEGGEPGRCAVWKGAEPIYFQKALHRVRPFDGVNSDYLALCILADSKFGRLESYFTGTGIKHFVGERLHHYVVPMPPRTEQVRIVSRANELLEIANESRQAIDGELKRAICLKQSILRSAFEGTLL